MDSVQLAASPLGASQILSTGELARRSPKATHPCGLICNETGPQVLTFKSRCKTLPSFLCINLKGTASLGEFIRPAPSLFSGPHKALQRGSWSRPLRHLFSDHRVISLEPHSPFETSLTITHFRSIARPEKYETEPHMDVKVSTFAYKEGEMLSVRVLMEMGFYQVEVCVREEDVILHWAVEDWSIPDKTWWPDSTVKLEHTNALEMSFTFVCQDHWQDKNGTWYNNCGFFTVGVKPLDMKDLLNQIVVPETNHRNWSMFSRLILLGWYRQCNYQPKDMAYAQERLASLMTEKVKSGKNPMIHLYSRVIQDEQNPLTSILNIMREHGIREGHRPGLEERFLEQWHQKLHQNTTPEDIYICEAYLDFLHTNSTDNFFRALWERGVSREWLETMDHPINSAPLFLPQLIPGFKVARREMVT